MMNKKNHDLEDFIDTDFEIKSHTTIGSKAKLSDFAKIEIPAIDPQIHKKISQQLGKIKTNLQQLKSFVKSYDETENS